MSKPNLLSPHPIQALKQAASYSEFYKDDRFIILYTTREELKQKISKLLPVPGLQRKDQDIPWVGNENKEHSAEYICSVICYCIGGRTKELIAPSMHGVWNSNTEMAKPPIVDSKAPYWVPKLQRLRAQGSDVILVLAKAAEMALARANTSPSIYDGLGLTDEEIAMFTGRDDELKQRAVREGQLRIANRFICASRYERDTYLHELYQEYLNKSMNTDELKLYVLVKSTYASVSSDLTTEVSNVAEELQRKLDDNILLKKSDKMDAMAQNKRTIKELRATVIRKFIIAEVVKYRIGPSAYVSVAPGNV
jgi:cell fate (sporulation/competence/biofilm development) regulator YmcA (YheA/YmcA/DUF963 family)